MTASMRETITDVLDQHMAHTETCEELADKIATALEVELPAPDVAAMQNTLNALYAEWPGGLEEIASAVRTSTKRLARIAELERQQGMLMEAFQTFAEWLGREEEGVVKAGNERDTPEGEQRWHEWYHENIRLCALAQSQARAAVLRAAADIGKAMP